MALVGAQFVNAVSPSPVGVIEAYAGASAPSGWLLCDGAQTLITAYPELYSVLGTTYGALTNGSGGAGSTHFRVPDLRGRMPMGAGTGAGLNASGTGAPSGTAMTTRTRGQWGGEETHLLTGSESGTSAHNHATSRVWTDIAGNHQHNYRDLFAAGQVNYALGTDTNSNGMSNSAEANAVSRHNTVPPFLVTNYIIKAVPDAPRSGLAYGSTPPIVTALPANPQFGDVVTYIADAANGVAWNLQYDATGTYPWKFIGGSPLYAFGGGGATNSTSYVDCGGASMTIALSGDYVFDYKCHFQLAAGESGFISCFFGTTAIDANGSLVYGSSANIDVESGRTTRQTIATAGSTVKTQNRMGSAVSRNFTNQTLLATPIRVKAA